MIQAASYYIKLKDVTTGEIAGFITCFGLGTLPASDDTFLLPSTVPPELINHGTQDTHFYCDGQLVAKPPKPSVHHRFNYTSKQWLPDNLKARTAVFSQRARLLAGSDWVTIRAADSGVPAPAAWLAYRQSLRDVTLQAGFPLYVVWPEQPSN